MKVSSASPHFPKSVAKKISRRIANTLKTGRFIMGPNAREFEEAFAKRIGSRYAVSVNSCTTALEIILRFIDVSKKEVIIPTNTFVATGNTVIYAGGTPIFADVLPETLAISFEDIKRKTTKRTKAIVLVHIGGIVLEDMPEILKWAKSRNIAVLEDCAHTIGDPKAKGKQAGSTSLAGAFSFWPSKIITTGTGGMLTTSSKKLADYANSFRYHGLAEGDLRVFDIFGRDACLNEFLASVGVEQFKVVDDILKKRRQVIQWYDKALKSLDIVSIPKSFKKKSTTPYKFWITFKQKVDVISLNKKLQKDGIESEFCYWPPLPLMPLYKKMKRYSWKQFKASDEALLNHICLPLHADIKRSEVTRVVFSLKKALGK